MSLQINSSANAINLFLGASAKGPILRSHVFDKELNCFVELIDCEVSNHAKIPDELPFGCLAEIVNQNNINKSRLKARIGPGLYEESGISWPELCQEVKNYTEYICRAKVCTQVVVSDFDVTTISATGLWEASLRPIDSRHSLLTKVVVLNSINQVDDVYDTELNAFTSVTRSITQTKAAPTITGTWPNITHTYYKSVRCGWWMKVVEAFAFDSPIGYVVPDVTNLNLPDVLTSVDIVWNSQSGTGDFATDWNGHGEGTAYSMGGAETGEAQASASTQPELNYNIKQYWGRDIPAYGCSMFLPFSAGAISEATLLTALTTMLGATVLRWPTFHPEACSFVCNGMKLNVSARASASAGLSYSASSLAYDLTTGQGKGYDIGTSVNVVHFPPTIHGAITVGGILTSSVNLSVTAAVGWVGSGSPVAFPSADVSKNATGSAVGSISPTSLAATTPSAIPSSGLYLTDLKVEKFRWGYARVYAKVINAANL